MNDIDKLEAKIADLEWHIRNLMIGICADHLWDEKKIKKVNSAREHLKHYANTVLQREIDEDL